MQGILANLTPALRAGERDLVLVRLEERVDVRLDESSALLALDDVAVPFEQLTEDEMSVVVDVVGSFLLTYGTGSAGGSGGMPRVLERSLSAVAAFERLRRMALCVLRACIPTPFFTALLKKQLMPTSHNGPNATGTTAGGGSMFTFGSSNSNGTHSIESKADATPSALTVTITPTAHPPQPHPSPSAHSNMLNRPQQQPRPSSPLASAVRSLSLPSLLPLLLGQTFATTTTAAEAAAERDKKMPEPVMLPPWSVRDMPIPFAVWKVGLPPFLCVVLFWWSTFLTLFLLCANRAVKAD